MDEHAQHRPVDGDAADGSGPEAADRATEETAATLETEETDDTRDPGRATDESMPAHMRRCIATRTPHPKDRLLRFAIDPDGVVVPDVDQRLPGRGLWLSPGRDMVEMAARKRLFARAARQQVIVPDDLADRIERLLTRRCLHLVGLARRAGQVVTGFEKVRSRLREAPTAGPPAALMAARDGARDGQARLAALAAAVSGARGGDSDAGQKAGILPVVVGFDAAELGQPLGRDRAVHVALERGKLARLLLQSCDLLAGFRPGPMVLSVAEAAAPAARGPQPAAPAPSDGA